MLLTSKDLVLVMLVLQLLFDEVTGAPTFLYNGAISANRSVPWYVIAQKIRQ